MSIIDDFLGTMHYLFVAMMYKNLYYIFIKNKKFIAWKKAVNRYLYLSIYL